MSNQIKVHTDANYRIRDGLGSVMQSARFFNKNNCMQNPSLRRNIISNHFVQPYTQRFDDGACDYNIARESDLQANSLQYDFRPQNYEEQLYGNNKTEWKNESNSKMNQAYNVGQSAPNFNASGSYYPGAYGNYDEGDIGSGVLGNFSPHDSNFAEQYKYSSPSPPQSLIPGSGGVPASPRNFGAIPPKSSDPTQRPGRYSNANNLVSYRQPNLNRVFNRAAFPRKGVSSQYSEDFTVQPQPRGGRIGQEPNFFFESNENYISNLYNTPHYANYLERGEGGSFGRGSLSMDQLTDTKMQSLVADMTKENAFYGEEPSGDPCDSMGELSRLLCAVNSLDDESADYESQLDNLNNKISFIRDRKDILDQNIAYFSAGDADATEGVGQAAGIGDLSDAGLGTRAPQPTFPTPTTTSLSQQ